MKTVKELFALSGRTAVITGGAGLLGERHAEALAEFGCVTVLLDTNKQKANRVADRMFRTYGIEALAYECDITQKSVLEDVETDIIKRFGGVDILINNAAVDAKVDNEGAGIPFSRLETFTLEQWNTEIAVGLTGSFLCAQVFGSQMVKKGKGVIINISSDLGVISPDQRIYRKKGLLEEGQPVKPVTYSVIKHGIIGLTKYLSTYWADKGVRANALCPAGVYNNQPEEFVRKISKLVPLGRMATQDEYKAAIVFLASDASSYMNGATLVIDGGRSIW